jgi:Holliday junction resolvasome RuvABC endonuclease subunit
VGRKFVLGIDTGNTTSCARVFLDGTVDVSSPKSETTMNARYVAIAGLIERHNTPDGLGAYIEEPFSGQFSSVKALFPTLGAAVLTGEHLELPWLMVNLVKLKIHATGRGNAKKPDMQAAAKARWGRDLKEGEADTAWAGACALDRGLFG